MYNRNPAGRSTLAGIGGFGGPVPRDLIVILAVVFATFALQFFAATRGLIALLRLTPLVWQNGFVWQLILSPLWGIAEGLLTVVGLGDLYLPWLGLNGPALIVVSP